MSKVGIEFCLEQRLDLVEGVVREILGKLTNGFPFCVILSVFDGILFHFTDLVHPVNLCGWSTSSRSRPAQLAGRLGCPARVSRTQTLACGRLEAAQFPGVPSVAAARA